GTDDDGIGFRVEARALPGRTTTLAPGLNLAGGGVRAVGPGGRLDAAGGRADLAVQATDVTFDEGPHPDFLASSGITGKQLADHAELVTGGAVDQQRLAGLLILDDGRCPGHGVTGTVITELLPPDHLAGVLVQRHDPGIQRAEEYVVAIDRSTAVDHVAAGPNIIRQAMGVAPQTLPGLGIQGEHPRIRTGDIDH